MGKRKDLNHQGTREAGLEPLLATPESWLRGHIPDSEGTLGPDFFRSHTNGKLSRLCN